jgi:cyclopropane-fatty-acyl-phospholipid synthase
MAKLTVGDVLEGALPMWLLVHLLNRFIRNGVLRLIAADGTVHIFGGHGPGPTVTARVHDARLYIKLFFNPELHAGEAYMNGTLTFEEGSDVGCFMQLFAVNRGGLDAYPGQALLRRFWRAARRWYQANTVVTAAANARHHYDLSTELYRLFLDDHLNYSCAIFEQPAIDTLEQAQQRKLRLATAKLRLRPGMTVAEIGSGWGAFAIHIAATTGAQVTAINVSPEQIRIARENAVAAGVDSLVEFRELDYRSLEGRFDRVVSVGMMEHVGVTQFDAYFGKIRSLLADDGFAFVHCIGRMRPPGSTGPFIRKYIFPGAYVPSLSEVFAATERTGLWVADMEVLRLHYHYTLQHWRRRFAANRARAAGLYDERFCRMWEYYLAAVDVGFSHGGNMVFQILLSAKIDAVPIMRDYVRADPRFGVRQVAN